MKLSTKNKLMKRLLIAQISIYAIIIIHSIMWHVFGLYYVTKLCPGKFMIHVGNLEFNFNVLFWLLIFISTLFVGRAFCGWGCMWGAYQDFVSRIFTKLGVKEIKGKSGAWILGLLIVLSGIPFVLSESLNIKWPAIFWFIAFIIIIGFFLWWIIERKTSKLHVKKIPKYLLLVHFLGSIILSWIVLNVFQKGFSFAFDKYGVLDDYLSIIGIILVIIGFGLTALGVAIEKRFFCKYVCPYGLLLRFLSLIPFSKRYKVRLTGQECVNCTQCNKICPMGIDVMYEINKYGMVKSPECINCLRCVAKCPKDTLDFTYEKTKKQK